MTLRMFLVFGFGFLTCTSAFAQEHKTIYVKLDVDNAPALKNVATRPQKQISDLETELALFLDRQLVAWQVARANNNQFPVLIVKLSISGLVLDTSKLHIELRLKEDANAPVETIWEGAPLLESGELNPHLRMGDRLFGKLSTLMQSHFIKQ